MAWVVKGGLRMKVGGALYRWWERNQLRIRGIVPSKRAAIVAWAKWAARQPGAATSYLYGGVPGIGTGTHTDCSGFALAAYRKVGILLRRTTQLQYEDAPRHPGRSGIKPGDLLFFDYEGPHSHVGIFIGDGVMIGDQHTGSGIVRVAVDWPHFDGAGAWLP